MDPANRKILVYQPVYVWLTTVVSVVFIAIAAWWLYQHGMHSAAGELVELKQQQRQLRAKLAALEDANGDLKQQLAILERSSEIDRRAALEVRNQFAKLTEEALDLRKELEFYRGIVSPKSDRNGLQIQRFELLPARNGRRYTFSLMLTQVRSNERYVRGVVEMHVEGRQDGNNRVLPYASVAAGEKHDMKFKFRYFQEFTGELELPEGFEPQRVTIRLKTSGNKQPEGVEKIVDWPS